MKTIETKYSIKYSNPLSFASTAEKYEKFNTSPIDHLDESKIQSLFLNLAKTKEKVVNYFIKSEITCSDIAFCRNLSGFIQNYVTQRILELQNDKIEMNTNMQYNLYLLSSNTLLNSFQFQSRSQVHFVRCMTLASIHRNEVNIWNRFTYTKTMNEILDILTARELVIYKL